MENLAWPINMDMVRSIAMLNPRLAYLLVRGHQLVPRSYNIKVTFEDTSVDQQLPAHLYEQMYQDAWIRDFRYTIKRPRAFNGSIYKWQSDYYANLQTYIDVGIEIRGEDKYQITNSFTPLESAANHVNSLPSANVLGSAWVITRDQNMYVLFKNTRAFLEDEVPVEVILTLHVLELSGCNFKAVDYTEALCALRKLGICPENC